MLRSELSHFDDVHYGLVHVRCERSLSRLAIKDGIHKGLVDGLKQFHCAQLHTAFSIRANIGFEPSEVCGLENERLFFGVC